MLTRMDHPNVVKIRDIIEPTDYGTFNELCICLELCAMDLKKYIKQDVHLRMFQVNTLVYHTLVGMQYVHACGIIHRDLKPANLLLVGPEGVVKVCDFGLARAVAGEGLHVHPLPNTPRGEGEDAPPPTGGHVPHTQNVKRVMTKHVVTRWYRAPELALLQDQYTSAIDVWSIGCIYAELLSMLEDGTDAMERGPLFPGNSCYPLSPARRSGQGRGDRTRGQHDQLEVIFDVIGTPSEAEIKTIPSEKVQKELRAFEKRKGKGLDEKLPFCPQRALDLLAKMLKFVPAERISVDASLQNVDIIFIARQHALSGGTPPSEVVLEFEKEPNLDEACLRKYFKEEITRFQSLKS